MAPRCPVDWRNSVLSATGTLWTGETQYVQPLNRYRVDWWGSVLLATRYPVDWRNSVLSGPRYPVDWRDSVLLAPQVPRYPRHWRDSVVLAPQVP